MSSKTKRNIYKPSQKAPSNRDPLKKKIESQKATQRTKTNATTSVDCIKTRHDLVEVTDLLKKSKIAFIQGLLKLAKIKDWKSLGYSSFKDYILQNFPDISYHGALSILRSALLEESLFGIKYVGRYSMNAMRVFSGLTPDQQEALINLLRKDWRKENEGDSNICPKWLTRAKVTEAKKRLFSKPPVNISSLDKESDEDSQHSKKSDPTEASNSTKRINKFKDRLNRFEGESSLVSFIVDFLVDEYYGKYGDKLPEKLMKLIHKKVKRLRSEEDRTDEQKEEFAA